MTMSVTGMYTRKRTITGVDTEVDDDKLVINWIGKTSNGQTGFFALSPVYGESCVQLAYGFMLLGLMAAQFFYAVKGKADAAATLDKFGLPTHLLVGIYVLPIFTFLALLEFIMARRLLKSEQLNELLSVHLDDADDELMRRNSLQMPMQMRTPTHLQKAKAEKGVQWMRKTLNPSNTKYLTRAMIVIFNLSIPICGLVFFWVCNHFAVSTSFFFCAVMPLLATWLFHLVSDTAIFVMAQFCKYRVMVMRSDFDSIIDSGEVQKGQFLTIMNDYIAMDEHLTVMSSRTSNLLLVSMAGIVLICWYCFAVALQAVSLNLTIFLVMVACSAGMLFLLLFLVYPLAQVTDLAISRTSLGKSSSLFVSIHKCGLLDMTAEVHGEYLRLLHLMTSCPIGIRIPIFGLLRTSDLATYAKTLAAAVPTLVTTAIHLSHNDDNHA